MSIKPHLYFDSFDFSRFFHVFHSTRTRSMMVHAEFHPDLRSITGVIAFSLQVDMTCKNDFLRKKSIMPFATASHFQLFSLANRPCFCFLAFIACDYAIAKLHRPFSNYCPRLEEPCLFTGSPPPHSCIHCSCSSSFCWPGILPVPPHQVHASSESVCAYTN